MHPNITLEDLQLGKWTRAVVRLEDPCQYEFEYTFLDDVYSDSELFGPDKPTEALGLYGLCWWDERNDDLRNAAGYAAIQVQRIPEYTNRGKDMAYWYIPHSDAAELLLLAAAGERPFLEIIQPRRAA